MRRYSEYKDSGVEWIGEIPSHWDSVDFRRCVSLKQGLQIAQDKRFETDGKNRYVYITVKYTNSNKEDIDTEYIEKPYKSVICYKDDVLLARTGATGKVITDVEGVFHNNFFKIIYDREQITKEYLVYYLKQETIQNYLKLIAGTTTIPDLNHGAFLSTKVVLPNLLEQDNICKYLDKKTSQIENLISKKEELIEILKVSRTKLISEAVTKGLDKDVPMKDSGVEWIGEIPSHWYINRLKYICNINPQKSEVRLSKYNNVSFLPMENVSLNTLILDTEKELADVYSGYTYFKDGDIVFAKVTPCFENGNMAIAKNLTNGVGFGSTELNVLRVDENIIEREFLYYVIQSDKFKNEAIANMYGVAGLKRISTKFIEDYNVLLPSIEEQKKIIKFLSLKTNYIDHIVSKTQEQIEILKKAKQKLITEVVTGKIDVRHKI